MSSQMPPSQPQWLGASVIGILRFPGDRQTLEVSEQEQYTFGSWWSHRSFVT